MRTGLRPPETGAALHVHTAYEEAVHGVVQDMRAAVTAKTRLTCSAGIAASAMLAKMASDINKPDGQFMISMQQAAVREFLDPLPMRYVRCSAVIPQ